MWQQWIPEQWHSINYFFRAKGRHGTHSPFVYAFIEQVLRAGSVGLQRELAEAPVSRSNSLAAATARFLSSREVILYKHPSKGLEKVLHRFCPGVIRHIRTTPEDLPELPADELLFLNMEAYQEALVEYLKNTVCEGSRFAVFCFGIHQNRKMAARWEQLCRLSHFPMTLDFWHAGCLVQDPAFKVKQHFVLRP